MSSHAVPGPFRRSTPTHEARLAREREDSLARVERLTERAIREERRGERVRDRLAWAALTASIALTVAAGVVRR